MKDFKHINYRLVLKRLQVAILSVKLITVIWELVNMAFNYLPFPPKHAFIPQVDNKI